MKCVHTCKKPLGQRHLHHLLRELQRFTLRIFARDAAGNASRYSNTGTFILPRDTTPPTKPAVTVTDVGPTHVSLAWSSVEDGPNVWFTVFMNGSAVRQGVRDTSCTFGPLQPETTYTFTAANLTDNGTSFQDGETWLFWQQSADNLDPQSVIRYDLYVNGMFDHCLMGFDRTVVYGNPGVENTYQVIAVDSAGNQSAPATLTTCAASLTQAAAHGFSAQGERRLFRWNSPLFLHAFSLQAQERCIRSCKSRSRIV